jgi:polysaccharide biosynthesis transport protein
MQYANANPNLRNGNNRRREAPGTLETLVRAVRRNWMLPVLLPVVVIAAAAIALNYVPRVYQASAQLRIDQQRSNLAVLDALQSLSSGSQIETEMVVLRSRTLAETVIDSLALRATLLAPRGEPRSRYFERITVHRSASAGEWIIRPTERGTEVARAGGPGEPRQFGRGEVLRFDGLELQLTREGQAAEIRLDVAPLTEAVRSFQRTLVVTRPSREADVVRITYEGADSVVVPEVVNTVVRHFIRRRQAEQSTEAVDMVRFLTEQIDTLSRQLVVAEAALQDFGERSGVVAMTAQAETQIGRLADMKAQRDLFDAERRSLQALVSNERGASRSLRDVVGFHTILKSPSGSELLRALNEAENVRAQMLQRYTPDNPDVQLQSQRIEELEDQLRGIAGSYLQGLNESVHALDDMLDEYSDELRRIPEQEITLARLKRQTTVLEDIHMLLQTRVKEAQIAAAVHDASVRLVDPAVVPGRPIRPRPMVSLAFATMLGIGMGLAGAVLRDHLDRTVRTRDELQARMPGLPILSVIPRAPATRQNGALVNVVERESPSAEAYRQLRTNLAFSTPDQPQHVIVMTSPTPGDGKSMTSANLAATLAQQGVRCLLVDADMRRGSLHDAFGEPRDPGLSQILANQVTFDDAVRTVALSSGGSLDLLPGGIHPPNPAELVGSKRLKTMLDTCRERYDLVILDAPPLNLVTDASIMATVADGVLVVVRAGVTRRDALEFAMDQLETVRAPLTGMVLNDVDLKAEGYYGSYEGYYGRRDAETPGLISRIVRGQRAPRR